MAATSSHMYVILVTLSRIDIRCLIVCCSFSRSLAPCRKEISRQLRYLLLHFNVIFEVKYTYVYWLNEMLNFILYYYIKLYITQKMPYCLFRFYPIERTFDHIRFLVFDLILITSASKINHICNCDIYYIFLTCGAQCMWNILWCNIKTNCKFNFSYLTIGNAKKRK